MPAGSALIVKGLDRLSRAEPLEAWSHSPEATSGAYRCPAWRRTCTHTDRWLKVKIEKEIVHADKIGNASEQTGDHDQSKTTRDKHQRLHHTLKTYPFCSLTASCQTTPAGRLL